MKKHQSETSEISDPLASMVIKVAGTMAERSRLNKELLLALAHAVGANERAQRRFRNAAFVRLSNIETTVQMIHGAQIAEAYHSNPASEAKMKEYAEAAQEYHSRHSEELGLKMVKFVYDDSEPQAAPPETKRKWSKCPSYDI